VDHVRSGHDLSERHASHLVSQPTWHAALSTDGAQS
jgi:hypothetical protein